MKIEPLANDSLRVWLSEEELNRWEMDGEGTAQRRAVRRLLRQIFRQMDRHPPARLSAELIPVAGGGVLLITPTSTYPSPQNPAVYTIAGPDELLELIRQWQAHPSEVPMPHCCLYEQGEGYDLAVYPVAPLTRWQQRLLAEYGHLLGSGEGLAAHCGEYGTLLVAGDLFTRSAPVPSVPEDRKN